MEQTLKSGFFRQFDRQPQFLARAPGRIEFIGNHTDYNGGCVLGAAIDRFIWAAVAKRDDHSIRLATLPSGDEGTRQDSLLPIVEVTVNGLKPLKGAQSWTNYPLGVLDQLVRHGMTADHGFDICFASNLPTGAGLSSSAAMELSTARALEQLYGYPLSKEQLARLCRAAENEFAGMPCGILDQGVSAFGQEQRLVHIDCKQNSFSTVAVPDGTAFWIFNTAKKHALVESHYETRHHECQEAFAVLRQTQPDAECLADIPSQTVAEMEARLPPELFRRALHITSENERVAQVVAYLKEGSLEGAGKLLNASHESSRKFFENSCAELDLFVDILNGKPGVLGSRLSGGGWGGAVIAFTRNDFTKEQANQILEIYRKSLGSKLENEPQVISARTGEGATAIPLD